MEKRGLCATAASYSVDNIRHAGTNKSNVGELEFEAERALPIKKKKQSIPNWQEISQKMQAIIDGESPAKPVNLIAAEFGVHISSLYNNVPDICKAVAKINDERRVKEARRRYVGLKERIRVLVHQYQRKGEYPSQDKIIGEIKINTKMVREVMTEVFLEQGVQKKTF